MNAYVPHQEQKGLPSRKSTTWYKGAKMGGTGEGTGREKTLRDLFIKLDKKSGGKKEGGRD